MMATAVASLGAVPMPTMWTPVGPDSVVGRLVGVLVTVCCIAMAVMWLIRWPTKRQSILFVVVSTACVAAFSHTSRYLAAVLATAAATSVACAAEMAMAGGALVALAKLLIIAVGVLAVPFSVHVLVHLLGDAR